LKKGRQKPDCGVKPQKRKNLVWESKPLKKKTKNRETQSTLQHRTPHGKPRGASPGLAPRVANLKKNEERETPKKKPHCNLNLGKQKVVHSSSGAGGGKRGGSSSGKGWSGLPSKSQGDYWKKRQRPAGDTEKGFGSLYGHKGGVTTRTNQKKKKGPPKKF